MHHRAVSISIVFNDIPDRVLPFANGPAGESGVLIEDQHASADFRGIEHVTRHDGNVRRKSIECRQDRVVIGFAEF